MFLSFNLNATDSVDTLPKWVSRDCKIENINKLVEFMSAENIFYHIKSINGGEVTTSAGDIYYSVVTTFDDSNGCKDREMITNCAPFGLDTPDPGLFTEYLLTGCLPIEDIANSSQYIQK